MALVFTSAIFLFAFFPVVFGLYHIVPGIRAKNIVLAAASLIFYSFGSVRQLPLLCAAILISWGAGRLLGAVDKKRRAVRRLIVTAAVVLMGGTLAAFKYLAFFADSVNAVFGSSLTVPALGLPLGISFFTFTGLGYVIEVYRKPAQMARSLVKVWLFVAMFPQLLSGPILSWKDAAPQLDGRVCTAEKTARGLRRFIVGLSKKLLIADTVGVIADAAFGGGPLDARLAWLGAVSYVIQIYFDFSGYSDMALGLSGAFGFTFPENFSHPYAALGMTDFWKRWHISLTSWFRSYVYMPLVMAKPQQRLYKRWAAKYGRARANQLAILIPSAVVWLLTGLWHGAAWSFVLWGLFHGLFCVLEGVGVLRTDRLKKTRAGRALLRAYTLAVVLAASVLFRAESLPQAGRILAAMLTGFRFAPETTLALQRCVTGLSVLGLVCGAVGSLPVVPWLRVRTGKWGEGASWAVCAVLLVLCVMSMAQSGFQPFIYQQF